MRESEIQRQITDYLTMQGYFWWRTALGGIRVKGARVKNPMKGYPDLSLIMPGGLGRLGVIECKVPKGSHWYPEQLEWRERLEAKGVVYIVGDSLEAVAKVLEAAS